MSAAENLVLGVISLQLCNVIQLINYCYYYHRHFVLCSFKKGVK